MLMINLTLVVWQRNTENGIKLNLVKYHFCCFNKSIMNYFTINANLNG